MKPLIQIFSYTTKDWLETLDTEATYIFLNEGTRWLNNTTQNQQSLTAFLQKNIPLYTLRIDLETKNMLSNVQVITLEDWVHLTTIHNPIVSY